jgi:isoquinoline 1-oxidoreductase beta subunit
MSAPAPGRITRREFLETSSAAGAGLLLGFYLPSRFEMRTGVAAGPFAPNAWLRIGADNNVLVIVDRSEMGQGISTSLPMLLAEELDADWTRIRFEFAPADKAYINPLFGMQGTGGSTSVRAAFTPLRQAGAQARDMLLSAAAQTWKVEKGECRTEKGAVLHPATSRRLTTASWWTRHPPCPCRPTCHCATPGTGRSSAPAPGGWIRRPRWTAARSSALTSGSPASSRP